MMLIISAFKRAIPFYLYSSIDVGVLFMTVDFQIVLSTVVFFRQIPLILLIRLWSNVFQNLSTILETK